MFTTTHNRKSNGRFTHKDDAHRTAAERKGFREAEAQLMARNSETAMRFDVHCQPPSFADLAAREGAKAIAAIHKGNAFNAGLYAKEAYRLAQMGAK